MQDTRMPSAHSIVVLLSARGGGDWSPVMALAVGLHARGHAVCLVCDTSTAVAVRSTGLPTVCLPPELEQGDIRPLLRHLRASGQAIGPATPNPLVEWAQVCAPAIRATLQARQPTVLLSSLFCMGLADQLASDFAVPWCFVNPSFYFGEDSARPWEADFLGLSVGVFRYWFQPLSQRATLILHATDLAFDVLPARLPGHHRYVGPLLWETPAVAPAFLRLPGPPWVLVSLSTLPQDGEVDIARAAIRVLQNEAVRALVTLTPEHARTALGAVPDNVYLSDYVPHSTVLPDSRLVISHAGHGIVMKALYHGVPMVLVPWGRDQPGVAARAEALGVAVVVQRDGCTDAAVAQAVRRILDDPRYTERVCTVSKRLQAEDAVTAACVRVESLWTNAAERALASDRQ
jgi:UDP:flavonoid glycosyltransferase YjiC (YdhE family)